MPTKALDAGFDAAVWRALRYRLPEGFDAAPRAPETFGALLAHHARTGRVLVWTGASEQTIFARPGTNWAFRAWHDFHHIAGRFPFTLAGETAACRAQCEDIRSLYGNTPEARRYCAIIWAEVVGQAQHFERTGAFPVDQREHTARLVAAELKGVA